MMNVEIYAVQNRSGYMSMNTTLCDLGMTDIRGFSET
jgi:hypothetical protein